MPRKTTITPVPGGCKDEIQKCIDQVVKHLGPYIHDDKCTVWAATRAVYNQLSPEAQKAAENAGQVPLSALWGRVRTACRKSGFSTPDGQRRGNQIRNQMDDNRWSRIEKTNYFKGLEVCWAKQIFKSFGKNAKVKPIPALQA